MKTTFNSLTEAGLKVTASMTTPSKPGKKPRPVFIVTGLVAGCEEIFHKLGGKKFRGDWSFWDDPSDEILDLLNKNGKLTFAEQIEFRAKKKLSRADRYSDYAANAQDRAERRSEAANAISSMIPMGQPILIGHHSESRHRRDLDRIHTNMRKSWEESEKAKFYTDKIDTLEYQVDRMKSRSYIGNRLREAEASLRRLEREARFYSDFTSRKATLVEQIEHWKGKLAEGEASYRQFGHRIPSPESLKQGFLVRYRGEWYPVVRASKKTVTIGNWLGIATMTFRLEYFELSEYRDPSESSAGLGAP